MQQVTVDRAWLEDLRRRLGRAEGQLRTVAEAIRAGREPVLVMDLPFMAVLDSLFLVEEKLRGK